MNRQFVLEFLRIILIAFVIAFVINIARIAIFAPWEFPQQVNYTEPETAPFEDNQNNTQTQNSAKINNHLGNEIVDIPVSPRRELSGLSKNEIYDLRRYAVKTSPIFSQMDYEPSSAVYGSITDNLPWISAHCALYKSQCSIEEKGKGVSRDSIGVLNPELLYYVSLAEYGDDDFYKDYTFVPYMLNYNPGTKTITAYYKHERNPIGTYQSIWLADANAHDLGYNFAYMNYSNNIKFYKKYGDNTLKADIKEITGYYMHGSVCGVPGGCNNYAPYWQYYNSFYLDNLPAEVNIKLWRSRPANPTDNADINFRMIFE